jgi:hypothetical protein
LARQPGEFYTQQHPNSVEHLCDKVALWSGATRSDAGCESATYLAQADDSERAEYLVLLCELPDGRWLVHLMALPWDNHVAENTFATAQQACEAADSLYGMGLDGGRWDVRRWGWQRPAPAPAPASGV